MLSSRIILTVVNKVLDIQNAKTCDEQLILQILNKFKQMSYIMEKLIRIVVFNVIIAFGMLSHYKRVRKKKKYQSIRMLCKQISYMFFLLFVFSRQQKSPLYKDIKGPRILWRHKGQAKAEPQAINSNYVYLSKQAHSNFTKPGIVYITVKLSKESRFHVRTRQVIYKKVLSRVSTIK